MNSNTLRIDFLKGPVGYRLQQKHQKELLAKAIGVKTKESLFVIDATAGMGRDSFLLASMNCKVLMLERSEILATQLEDALKRALADERYKNLNIDLKHIDAKHYLQQIAPGNCPDVIYLDPMFPERKKSALVKKEMQYLQTLIGQDEDAGELFSIALNRAKKRVVVKRPRLAKPLANSKPHHTFTGKSVRFDVYTN